MADERRYTLDEAAEELRLRECKMRGHDWRVHVGYGDIPVWISCDRCGVAHRIVAEPSPTPIGERPLHMRAEWTN